MIPALACNVLRMVKMFGWEREMHERVATRREIEVKWLWKRKVYDLFIAITKYAFVQSGDQFAHFSV